MVRLTAELIEQSAQYTNPVRERELDLRGYRIPVIENLGATLDQFDTIDFSDNDIRKLDGFPLLRRLKSLLFNNNRIVRIGEDLTESISNLETLVLTNNGMQELGDLDPLSSLPSLEHLSLLRNPVTTKKNYRLYVIHKIPQIRVLDFQRIKMKERQAAAKLFKGKKGQQLVQDLGKRSKSFVPGEKLPEKRNTPSGPTKEEMDAIKKAIANAKSLDEVERLNQMLKSGQVPGRDSSQSKRSKGNS
ncbi:U2 small nuclear ribonucleoprotein A' isoform X2 [Patella vulgata]|uniref:U2 small nuclear ribonucleoprotein A' isoform X2 n=1 Tax=Patella vulgata TaxID=6465 RepID=UPI0021805FE2|nr:U2 small nuclear ribonucleoprotein A' isoform X2 [Patella vulgata]